MFFKFLLCILIFEYIFFCFYVHWLCVYSLSLCSYCCGFQLRLQKLNYGFYFLLKKWCLFCDSVHFSCYIVLHSSDFLVTVTKIAYLSVFAWIFSLTFLLGSFKVCYSFVRFVYVYSWVHQCVVLFCFEFLVSVLCSDIISFLYFWISIIFMSALCSIMSSVLYFLILVMFFKCPLCI